jgi:hypothetical protein
MLKLSHKIPDITPKHLAHEVPTTNPLDLGQQS